VSTGAGGLTEANFLAELQVLSVPLVHDSRTRQMLRGITMEQAEQSLNPERPGQDASKATLKLQRDAELAHTLIASEEEVAGFVAILKPLLEDCDSRRKLGEEARKRAEAHILARNRKFTESLHAVVPQGIPSTS